MAITSGLYELRSMLLTSMAVDIAGGSAIRGANVQLYGSNDTNAQKFYVVEESASHWSIQNAQSSLYMDVASGTAANGTNIQQWSDNDTRAQRWNLIETGSTTTINGVACPIVYLGSYVTSDGTTWVADVTHAMTTNKTNIQLHSANSTPAQRFALYPTTLQDVTMPAPSGRGWAATLGAANSQAVQPTQAALYPCWYFTDAWNGLGQHGFEISYRSRYIASGTATNGEWGSYTAWEAADVTLYGQTAWLTDGLPATFDTAAYKAIEYNLRVRSTSVLNSVSYHSKAITMTLRAVFAPTVTCTGIMRMPDVLRLTLTSDYEGGTTAVRVTSIKAGTKALLSKPIIGYGYGPLFTMDIPLSNLASTPFSETSVTVSYEVGTDQYPATGVTRTDTVSIGDAATRTLTITCTTTPIEESRAYRVALSGASSYTGYAYVNGEQIPVYQNTANTFIICYPFTSEAIDFTFIGISADATAWGAAVVQTTSNMQPCHMWNWGETGTDYFKLDIADGFMQTSRTVKADFTDYQLNGREWHSLRFSNTKNGEYTAEGVLKDGLTDSTTAKLMELMSAHNVTYRAPSGELATVAITEIQYTTIRKRTSVTISMVQVST